MSGDAAPAPLPPETSRLDLLELYRRKWREGDWEDLATQDLVAIEAHPERARLTLFVAAALSQVGDLAAARSLLRQAAAWGCKRPLIANMMLSMVHNSLGRAAASIKDDAGADEHFAAAIRLVEPHEDAALLARGRRVRETARMGLLPDASDLLNADWKQARKEPVNYAARLASMRTEIDLLNHELALSLKRGQIMNPQARSGPETPENLEARAVSQLGQDLWVLERTGYKRGGFFVEFGATDGVKLSNSYLLETEYGWNGICAEPNPELFRQLQQNRSCITSPACIGGVTGQEVEFILADAFGGIAEYAQDDPHAERREAFRQDGRVMHVTTVSLDDFLVQHNAPREIDFMSIDTEGSEYEILSHFPFDRWRIRLMTIEHNRTPMREKIQQLLEPLGYKRTEMGFDDWYELED
ncbi:FkbM family methyltransferase [Ancylobacter sp. G4_0304]|uniref:FkbM family methyltransferase n=1 Tax=Ancylobacter sp. G4_0304 TaxID=3114289 RepID=UPI0039C747EF